MLEYLALGLTCIILPWLLKKTKNKNISSKTLLIGGLLFILSSAFAITDFWQYSPGFNLAQIITFNVLQFLAWTLTTIGIIQNIIENAW